MDKSDETDHRLMQTAGPPHINIQSHTHTRKLIILAAKMMHRHSQSDSERFICTLFAN